VEMLFIFIFELYRGKLRITLMVKPNLMYSHKLSVSSLSPTRLRLTNKTWRTRLYSRGVTLYVLHSARVLSLIPSAKVSIWQKKR
jgi:hypothetical protein